MVFKRMMVRVILFSGLLTVFLFCPQVVARVQAEEATPAEIKRLVFLDPGHGGHDVGARSPDALLEKEITSQLARLVAEKLSKEYQVKFPMVDNDQLEIVDRTGMANNLKADLFLSFHVAGRFRAGPGGFYLYYYEIPASRSESAGRFPLDQSLDPKENGQFWSGIQYRHLVRSRQLVKFIEYRLRQFSKEPVYIGSANLLVLAGADMPAVLIETGPLTNPVDEKKIRDVKYLSGIADAVSSAVRDFFGENPSLPSIDLHE